jgi:hypothetical protein
MQKKHADGAEFFGTMAHNKIQLMKINYTLLLVAGATTNP